MREIRVYEARHDCPHEPSADPNFQESTLFVWNCLKGGGGGFLRLSHEPNVRALNACFGVFTEAGVRFRCNVTGLPMSQGDRGEAHMAWGEHLRVDLDRLAIRANFPDCQAELQFEDFFPRYDYMDLVNLAMPEGHDGHHFEVAGRMRGRLRLGGGEIEVDALGYRDRSWGSRRWDTLRSTRWWPAVFGPDLVAHVLASVHEAGFHGAHGYVIRDGVPLAMTEVDLTVTLDYDAIGPRSGNARFVLENGERGELVHARSDAVLMYVRGYSAVESVGQVRWGDRIGMSNLEAATNASGGTKPPVVVLGASCQDGLTRRGLR